MTYICYKNFKNTKVGDRVSEQNGWLTKDGVILCFWRSQNAKDHFFKDDDGNGLAKAEILSSIRTEIEELPERHVRLRESLSTSDMPEEEKEEALARFDGHYEETMNEFSKLPCFASLDAPYEATLEELQAAYDLVTNVLE